MPRLSPLPEQLKYLQPFRKQVAKLKPEEVEESMDLSLLNTLLLKRIENMPPPAGKQRLEIDQKILEGWLEAPACVDNGGMVFLRGYLMALPDLVDHLLEERNKPKPVQSEFSMELPVEAKIKKLCGGVWKVRWLRATLFALPSDKEYIDSQIKDFHEGPRNELSKVTVTSVKFGKVTGLRRFVDHSIVGAMHVDYVLTVPGGYAAVTLLKKATAIDPAKFEQYFHTIRVIRG